MNDRFVRPRRAGRGDQGFAMITAILVITVAIGLTTVIAIQSQHTAQATARDRSWTQSIHIAEAGVQNAMARLQSTLGVAPSGTITGSVPEGEYSYTVQALPRSHYRIISKGTAGTVQGLRASRQLDVILAPPLTFRYALFSLSDVTTKNNNNVKGDIWANGSVDVYSGDTVDGSVVAATGIVTLNNGSIVKGDAWSGGTNGSASILVPNNALIEGNVKASTTEPCVTGPNNQYGISIAGNGEVRGNATTWAASVPGNVGGTKTLSTCTVAPPTKGMPAFTFNPANYDPAIVKMYGTTSAPSATAVSDFQAWVSTHSSNFSGVYYVYQSGAVGQSNRIDLSGVTIGGDTVIITNVPIYSGAASSTPNDALLILYSSYAAPVGSSCDVNKDDSECAIHAKNNFQLDASGDRQKVAVLVFAPNGPVAIKNNARFDGAIYAQNIEIKNNMDIVYDARVDQVIGFGDTTLSVEKWVETPPS